MFNKKYKVQTKPLESVILYFLPRTRCITGILGKKLRKYVKLLKKKQQKKPLMELKKKKDV